MFQPDRADNQLEKPDNQHHVIDLIILKRTIEIQPVTEKEQRADDRMRNVIRERHLPDGFQAAEKTLYFTRFVKQNEGSSVRHHQ